MEKVAAGKYKYKGLILNRRKDVNAGNYGAWTSFCFTATGSKVIRANSLAQLKLEIDNFLQA